MPVDKDLATKLGDAVGDFVNQWAKEHNGGALPGNEALSMLITHAGKLIAGCPCPEARARLISQAIGALVASAEAPVIVSVCPVVDAEDAALLSVEPAGRA